MSYDTWLESPYQTEESAEDIHEAVERFSGLNSVGGDFDLAADVTFTRNSYTITVFQGSDEGQRAIIEFDESLAAFDEWVDLISGYDDEDDVLAELDRAADEYARGVESRAFAAFAAFARTHPSFIRDSNDDAYEPGSPKRSDYREKANA